MTTIAALKAQWDSLFPNNNEKQISASDLRTGLKSFTDALYFQLEPLRPYPSEVTLTPNSLNTVLTIPAAYDTNFTLNVIGIAENLITGVSKLTLIVKANTNVPLITFAGNIQFMQCGSPQETYQTDANLTRVFPLIWDGVNFTGIDNC